MSRLLHLARSDWAVPLVVVLMGLAPLWWAPIDVILISEDAALPRPPDQFRLALYSWNPLLNTGTPYNVVHSTLLAFAQQSILLKIGIGVALTQRLIMVLWFTLPGLSVVFLVWTILRDWTPVWRWKVAAIAAASFYMFNLYLENVWLGFNMAVLTAQATLPAFLALLYLAFSRRISLRLFALLFAPVALWASGIGVNPPMVVVVLGALVAFVGAYPFITGRSRSLDSYRRVGATLAVGITVALPLNAFWLLPFVEQIRATTGAEITGASELASTWLAGLSNATSFPNVLRFQGDWTWYQGWKEPYRVYAADYRAGGALGVLAWVTPALALVGALWRGPRIRHYFSIIAAAALLLSMGIHEPMAGLYLWLVDHVPLFWIVRSPWFKFTLITTIGTSFLIGLAVAHGTGLVLRMRGSGRVLRRFAPAAAAVVPLLAMGANLAYAYPVTTGAMFSSSADRQFLPPNRLRLPDEVLAASRWIDAQAGDPRVAVLPDTTVWVNTWGYNGFAPALTQLGTTPVVYPFRTVFGSLVSATNAALNEVAYDALYEVKTRRVDELFKLMSVRYLSHETDVMYWLYAGDTDSPDWVRGRLALQQGVGAARTFGSWDIYPTEATLPRLFQTDRFYLAVGGVEALPPLVGAPHLSAPAILFSDQARPEQLERALASPSLGGLILYEAGPDELVFDLVPESYRHPLPQAGKPVRFSVDEPGAYEILLKARVRGAFPSGELSLDGGSIEVARPRLKSAPFWIRLDTRELDGGVHTFEGSFDETIAARIAVVPQGVVRGLRTRVERLLQSPAAPVTIVATSETGARPESASGPRANVNNVRVQFGEHLPEVEQLDDGTAWRWLVPDGTRSLLVVNPSDADVRTNVRFQIRSHQRSRDLYVYLNEQQVILDKMPADRTSDLLLSGVVLRPGENVIRLYSPFPGTPVGDRQLSFAVKDDSLRAGRLDLVFPVEVFRPGAYVLQIRPYGPEANVARMVVQVDGRPVPLDPRKLLGETTFVADLTLSAGSHEVRIDQQEAEHYALRVLPARLAAAPLPVPESVEVLERSPTRYRVRLTTDGPAILVFGDSFDPRWRATAGGVDLAHYVVNGFGNGYEIPDAGTYEIEIDYGPQRLFVWGAAVSLAAIVAVLVATLTAMWRRRAGRTRESH